MTGGILQFISWGPEDMYIIGNPEISFFKALYRRHTNFAIESVEEFFYNEPNFGKISKCKLSKKYDLITNVSLMVSLPSLNECNVNIIDGTYKHEQNEGNCACKVCLAHKYKEDQILFGWANSIGHVLLENYTLEIAGMELEVQYGEWLEIWSELSQPLDKRMLYNEMIGKVEPPTFTVNTFSSNLDLIVPLGFWFCRNVGNSLPVLSLYNSDIEIGIKFREFDGTWVTNTPNVRPSNHKLCASLLIDYILLDYEERHKFYSEPQTYLIEKINYTPQSYLSGISSAQIELRLRYAVKEFIFVFQRDDVCISSYLLKNPINNGYPLGNDWFNFTPNINRKIGKHKKSFEEANILINGTERFEKRNEMYFKKYQPYMYHTRGPTNNIYVYSFSLRPEEAQPTGHFNFFNFINTQLNILFGTHNGKQFHSNQQPLTYTAKVYNPYYNIFYVENGVGAILFS